MNIEQAKQQAAKEAGFESFGGVIIHERIYEGGNLDEVVNRAMELCIEGERQRIMEALPSDEDAAEIARGYPGTHGESEAYENGIIFMREKVKELLK